MWPLLIAAAATVVGLLAGYDPLFAIVAALAIGFMLLAFGDLSLGVTCFAVLAAADLVPSGSPLLSVTKAAGLILAISWLALVTTREDQQDFAHACPAMAMVLVAFLGWALLSATWAEDPARSVSAAGRFALNVVLFLIVFTAIRTRARPGHWAPATSSAPSSGRPTAWSHPIRWPRAGLRARAGSTPMSSPRCWCQG